MRDGALPDPWTVPWVSITMAGRILHLSRSAAYRAVQAGDIPTVRVAGRLRVPVADLYRVRRLPLPAAPAAPGPAPRIWAG